MNMFRLIARSLIHDRAIYLLLGCVVAIMTGIILGAFLLGDSMRFSLKQLSGRRLADIDSVLIAPYLLESDISGRLASLRSPWESVVPGVMIDGIITCPVSGISSGATVIGVTDDFWNLWSETGIDSPSLWGKREIVVNNSLASQLSKQSGRMEVDLMVRPLTSIASDTILVNKEPGIRRRFTIRNILPDNRGAAGFSINNDQQNPFIVFVPLETFLSDLSEPQAEKNLYNCLFFINRGNKRSVSVAEGADFLAKNPLFTLNDLGIRLVAPSSEENNSFTPIFLQSRQFTFAPTVATGIETALKFQAIPTISYLANSIEKGGRIWRKTWQPEAEVATQSEVTDIEHDNVPYSMITGVPLNDSRVKELLFGDDFALPRLFEEDEVIVNRFVAEQLALLPGDTIRIRYYEPESFYAEPIEREATFRVAAIAPNSKILDNLVPKVDGITDAVSLADWNPPFPFDMKRIKQQDEDYWDEFGIAPKIFLQKTMAEKLFQSRFGTTTVFVVLPPQDVDIIQSIKSLTQTIESSLSPAACSLSLISVKEQAVRASQGTTPFDVLFFCLSFFVIASVLILLAMLIKISIEMKTAEIGLMRTLGFATRTIRVIIGLQFIAVLFDGILLGLLLGTLYAKLLVHGLTTVWVGVIGTPFLTFSVTFRSFILAAGISFFIGLLVIYRSTSRLEKISPISMIRNVPKPEVITKNLLLSLRLVFICYGIAILAVVFSLFARGPQSLPGFFVAAMSSLAGSLLFFYRFLTQLKGKNARQLSLLRLVLLSFARNPQRTTLTVGLLASSFFLIVAVGAFRLTPNQTGKLHGPDGRFELVSQTQIPFFAQLHETRERNEVLLSSASLKWFVDNPVDLYSIRVRPGQKVGCSNLYRANGNLRLIGLPQSLIDRGGFSYGATLAGRSYKRPNNPLLLLNQKAPPQQEATVIPIMLDQNTAYYSLEIYLPGQLLPLTTLSGETIFGKVVGFFSQSIFQSDVVMSESNLLRYFPEVQGYQMIVADLQAGQSAFERKEKEQRFEQLAAILQTELSDCGLKVIDSQSLLENFYAVQNGYISIFQGLGLLGLALGIFGFAGMTLRNVLERQREWAILDAIGFRKMHLRLLVAYEGGILVFVSLILAALCAILAITPSLMQEKNTSIELLLQHLLFLAIIVITMTAIGAIAGIIGLSLLDRCSKIDILKREI